MIIRNVSYNKLPLGAVSKAQQSIVFVILNVVKNLYRSYY